MLRLRGALRRAFAARFSGGKTLSQSKSAADNVVANDATAQPKSLPEANAPSSEVLLERILTSLDEDKAEDIVQIDLAGKSAIADYMVVCSGRSARQVTALAEKLADRLKQEFGRLSRTEGKGSGDWVLVDTGDVIVHVFRPEVREFYQLEKMWMDPTAGPDTPA